MRSQFSSSKVLFVYITSNLFRFHPSGTCGAFDIMSEHCQNNMDSCREFFDYCMKRSQAEKDGRSLEPDLRYVLPGLGKDTVDSIIP